MLDNCFDGTLVERCSNASLQQHLGEANWEWTSKIFGAPAFDKVGSAYHRAASTLTLKNRYAIA
jgi:hypothetical protein